MFTLPSLPLLQPVLLQPSPPKVCSTNPSTSPPPPPAPAPSSTLTCRKTQVCEGRSPLQSVSGFIMQDSSGSSCDWENPSPVPFLSLSLSLSLSSRRKPIDSHIDRQADRRRREESSHFHSVKCNKHPTPSLLRRPTRCNIRWKLDFISSFPSLPTLTLLPALLSLPPSLSASLPDFPSSSVLLLFPSFLPSFLPYLVFIHHAVSAVGVT